MLYKMFSHISDAKMGAYAKNICFPLEKSNDRGIDDARVSSRLPYMFG